MTSPRPVASEWQSQDLNPGLCDFRALVHAVLGQQMSKNLGMPCAGRRSQKRLRTLLAGPLCQKVLCSPRRHVMQTLGHHSPDPR